MRLEAKAIPTHNDLLYADGRFVQTYDAIFTVANPGGDWRLISRNPFNVRKA